MNFDGVELKEVDNIPCDDGFTIHTAGEYLGREQNDNVITTRYRCDDCDKIIEDVYVEEKVGERIIDEKKEEYSEDFG
tara:strand:+ start:873 stop:1106 length:234 start_codon:yes stop_codon:yes gene_type:complete